MENKNLFYVTDPTEQQDSFGMYVSYLVRGAEISEPISRRFREFDLLRTKLFEKYPGFWIPPLSKKKMIGNKNKEIVEERLADLNRFCKFVSSSSVLKQSKEISLFLTNIANCEKMMMGLPKEGYKEQLDKYKNLFELPEVY